MFCELVYSEDSLRMDVVHFKYIGFYMFFKIKFCAQSSSIELPLVSSNLTILQKGYPFSDSQLLKGAIRKGGTIQGRKCANTRSGTNISPSYKEKSFCSKWVHDRDTKYSFVLYLKSKPKEGHVPIFVKKRLSSYIILLHSFFSILHPMESVA